MKWPGRAETIPAALGLLFAGYLFGSDLADALRARSAPLAALHALPNAAFAAVTLVALGLAAAIFVVGALQGRPASFRGYRLLPIVAVVAVFADLFVLGEDRPPLSSAERLELTLRVFGSRVDELTQARGELPTDDELRAVAHELGQPPFLINGAPAAEYQLVLRSGCEAPISEPPAAGQPTLFFCRRPGGKDALLSAAALPFGQRFGRGAPFTRDAQLVAFSVGLREDPGSAAPDAEGYDFDADGGR